jgi:flagellar protein FliS
MSILTAERDEPRTMGTLMGVGGVNAYRRIQTETASSGELVLRLYEALLRDLERAGAALGAEAPLEQAHAPLVHAQEIVIELLACLDMSAGELPQHLADLYQYMYQRLVYANVNKDQNAVNEVQRLLTPIRDAWCVAIQPSTPAIVPARLAA